MSYVPATTTKNGTTLSLVDVEWQVTGTDLVGEALVPSRYQAVATYSASSSYSVATGYVTTAEYSGEVTAEGIESVTYTVVYTGAEIVPVEVEVDPPETDFSLPSGVVIATSGGILLAILLGVLTFWLLQRRKTVFLYIPDVRPNDYKLVAKFRVTPEKPEIDITGADTENSATVAVEIKRSLSKSWWDKSLSYIIPLEHTSIPSRRTAGMTGTNSRSRRKKHYANQKKPNHLRTDPGNGTGCPSVYGPGRRLQL